MPPEYVVAQFPVLHPLPPTVLRSDLHLSTGKVQVAYLVLPGQQAAAMAWFDLSYTYGMEAVLAEICAILLQQDLVFQHVQAHVQNTYFFRRQRP